jgi:hypothetical protein
MKYLLSVLLLFLVSCSSTEYTGVVTDKYYESGKYSTSGHITFDQFHIAVKDTQGHNHMVELEEQEFLDTKVGDTITFKD